MKPPLREDRPQSVSHEREHVMGYDGLEQSSSAVDRPIHSCCIQKDTMMATTHALAGAAVATVTFVLAPEYAPIAVFSGFMGGVFPDLDLYRGHRRSLHFPVYYSIAVVPAVGLAVVSPSRGSIALALFLVGAALHSATDVLGGSLELRPWQGQSERAVFSHFHGRWLRPRRWIPYDGAPEDLVLAGVLALPTYLASSGRLRQLVGFAVLVSTGYTLLRKPLADAARVLAAAIPPLLRPYVPERYL
ncbi:MAG: hypothetical protein ACI8VE_001457 [Natrialbaceae archaeon]|jgi:hypothetical protein